MIDNMGAIEDLDQRATCTDFCVVRPNLGKIIVTPIGAFVSAGAGALVPMGRWKDVYRAP